MSRFRMLWPIHTFWVLTKFIGMRDRLRCPKCGSVGTWKPHGGWIEQRGTDRRWLCKWCGYYNHKKWPEAYCKVSNVEKCWVTPDIESGITTPAEAIKSSEIPNAWPWRG